MSVDPVTAVEVESDDAGLMEELRIGDVLFGEGGLVGEGIGFPSGFLMVAEGDVATPEATPFGA